MEKQFTPYTRWINQHAEKIKAEYPDRPTAGMAQEMGVSYYTVSRRATRLGVSKSPDFMHSSWKKGAGKKGGWKKTSNRAKNSEAADAYLKEHFATTKNETLAKHFCVDVKTVRRWARRLGLVKSEAFMQVARDRGHRNGRYYTEEQIAYRNRRIAEVYPDGDKEALQRLSEELGIKVDTIQVLASSIGLKRNRIGKYTPQFVAALADYFPTHTDKECAARFGITKVQVQGIARSHGWHKTTAHLHRIYDSNITAAKRANRERRGSTATEIISTTD